MRPNNTARTEFRPLEARFPLSAGSFRSRARLHLISGFLGSGKTSLVRDIADELPVEEIRVLVSEAGALGVDQAIIGSRTRLISNCLCCRGYDNTLSALHDLAREITDGARIQNVFVETSGLSDVGKFLFEMASDLRFAQSFEMGQLITTVDSVHATQQADDFIEWHQQVRAADIIVLTREDSIRPHDHAKSRQDVISLVRGAGYTGSAILARDELVDELSTILERPPLTDDANIARVLATSGSQRELGHDLLHYVGFRISARYTFESCLALAKTIMCLAPRLVRLKACLPAKESAGHAYIVQIVAGSAQPIELIPTAQDSGSVFMIDRHLTEPQVRPLFSLFEGKE
jgi:G3E family GTPase